MNRNIELLDQLIGSSEQETCIFGRDGRIIYCSETFEKLLEGYSSIENGPLDTFFESLEAFMGVSAAQKAKDCFDLLWEGKADYEHLECQFANRHVLLSLTALNSKVSGEVDGISFAVQDITPEIKRKSDFLMSTLVSHAPQAVALISHEGEILRVNPAFCDLYGMSSGKLEGDNITRLVNLDIDEIKNIEPEQSQSYYDKVMLISKKHRFPVEVVVGSYRLELSNTPLHYVMITDLRAWQEKEALKRRMSIMSKQRDISADLHDNVAQSLALVKMKFDKLIPDLGEHIPPELVGEVVECRKAVDNVQVEMRQMIRYLREESSVRQEDCLWGIEEVLRYGTNTLGLDIVDMGLANMSTLADRVQRQLTQLIREALTNVHKHAGSSIVWLTAVLDDDRLIVNVVDKGKGFDVDKVDRSEHYGLSILSERAQDLGGEMQVSSQKGVGTDVTFVVPVRQKK